MSDRGHDFTDHTADWACEIWAPSLPELLAEAGRAFTDTLTSVGTVRPRDSARTSVTAASAPDLLVEWLQELLYLFETTGLLAAEVRAEVHAADTSLTLEAEILGEPFDPDRHPLKTLVKGVTYHRLAVLGGADGWRARVIFDI